MAGKELKATEKTVLKHSRDGVLEQNLADGSAKKVSNKAEEAVLKKARPDDERFDKLKAAGLVVEDVKKPDHRKLQFGRNNPDNTWAEAVYGNKPKPHCPCFTAGANILRRNYPMFFTKPITPPIIREEFDASKYRGVDKADIKAIHLALQNSEKLTIDRYGHIFTADGRWIADGMMRE